MPHALGRRSLLSRRHDQPNHHHLETPRSGPWPRFRFTSSIHPGPSVMHPTVWRTNVTGACTNSRPSNTAQRVRKSACFFARRPEEHLRRIPLFPWTAARIREIQSWRWPQPEVMLQKNCCKMNIVTKFSKLSCFIYWLIRVSFYYIYSFILHSHHLKDFLCFFRALGEPLDQDSVPVGQSLKYTSINQHQWRLQVRDDLEKNLVARAAYI